MIRSRHIARIAGAALIIALITAVASGVAGAQTPGPPRLYDPQTVETVRGEIVGTEQVKRAPRGRGGGRLGGLHVSLKSGDSVVSVHLGPSWYLAEQGLQLTIGDRVEVRGSRITFDGQPAIIAAEVTKGERRVRLRDDAGVPAWSGRAGSPRAPRQN